MGTFTSSAWGCVLKEIGEAPISLKAVERPFRVTSATLQHNSPALSFGQTISVLMTLQSHDPPLEVAFFDLTTRHVTLGVTYRVGDTVVFHKRTTPSHFAPLFIVQLNGVYLNEAELETQSMPCVGCSHMCAINSTLSTFLESNNEMKSYVQSAIADLNNSMNVLLYKIKADTHEKDEKKRKQEEDRKAMLEKLKKENSKLRIALAKIKEENKRQEDENKVLLELEDELKKIRFD